MREVKFRGKNKKGWHCGLLTRMFGQYAIVNPNDENNIQLVDEKSIGQYTGVKDRQGKEIYEGDVFEIQTDGFLIEKDEVYYTCRGTWDCASYLLGGLNEEGIVIGNIYENPELLEESK